MDLVVGDAGALGDRLRQGGEAGLADLAEVGVVLGPSDLGLDVLVQNAAIMTTGTHPGTVAEYATATRPSIVPLDEMRAVWETNVFGVLAVSVSS